MLNTHLIKIILKKTVFLLWGFYLLYVVLDCAFKMHLLMNLNTSQVLSLPSYYLHVLLKRLDILLPLALTLSIPHTYHALHNLGQITLLRLNGYSTFSLLKPALCVCTAMMLILTLHSAYVYPYNHHAITKFEHKAFHKAPPVLQRIISLSDSQLFYSGTYPHLQQAYWVHKEKIDYIDTLNIQENLSHGTSITTFIKKNGHFIKTNYQKKRPFLHYAQISSSR